MKETSHICKAIYQCMWTSVQVVGLAANDFIKMLNEIRFLKKKKNYVKKKTDKELKKLGVKL